MNRAPPSFIILFLVILGSLPTAAMRVKKVIVWPICVSPRYTTQSRDAATIVAKELDALGFQLVEVRRRNDYGHKLPEPELSLMARGLTSDALVTVEVTDIEPWNISCQPRTSTVTDPYLVYTNRRWRDPRNGRWYSEKVPTWRYRQRRVTFPPPSVCGNGFQAEVKLGLVNAYTDNLTWKRKSSEWDKGQNAQSAILKAIDSIMPKLGDLLNDLPA